MEVVPREVARQMSCQAEVGHTLGEAGNRGWEEEPNQGRCCTEEGRPEGEGGTRPVLHTLVQQGQEGALSGDDWSCGLCSCKTCPMIYVLLGANDVALGFLIDVMTCLGEEGGPEQLNGSHCYPVSHFQTVPEVLAFALMAEALIHQEVVAHTPVVVARRVLWCAQESGVL